MDLVTACENYDDPPYRTALIELEEEFTDGEGRDPEHNTMAAVAGSGAVVAYGRVRMQLGGQQARVFLGGGVHPDLRRQGVGGEVLRWEMDRARQILAGVRGRCRGGSPPTSRTG